jgi:hypothetical protein
VANAEKCHGVICGHIHQPANKHLNGIHYLNSGDWVETLSALVETPDGKWNIIHYADWAATFHDTGSDESDDPGPFTDAHYRDLTDRVFSTAF